MKPITGLGLAVILGAGSSGPVSASKSDRVPPGPWGGVHVRLTVTDEGGKIEFDCAHGTLDSPLALDDEGRFDVPGTLVREGGPVRKDAPEERQSVRYAGRTDGQTMDLELRSAAGERKGSFQLERGKRAVLRKCL